LTKTQTALDRLLEVVQKLRSPQGCPWDREQTHESLKPFLVEETYEALEAIDNKDMPGLCGEMGDVLLQVVLHAQLATEQKLFNFEDVVNGITDKMIRRHPHVFSDVTADTVDAVLNNWEQIKREEKSGAQQIVSVLDNVPKTLPSLSRADKLQRRAARLGFDWDNVAGAWDKVHEEIAELKEATASPEDQLKIQEELGDLIFSVVNVARKLNMDAEEAHRGAINKFRKRFRYIEDTVNKNGQNLHDMTLAEMDKLWEEAKGQA